MRAFLSTRFAPKHAIEFRAIRGSSVRRFWAMLTQIDPIEPHLRRLDNDGWNIYSGVNPRLNGIVRELVSFHADIDRAPNLASLGENPTERGVFSVRLARVPEPSVVVNSGHGLHLYWILDSPVAVTDANRDHLRAINRGLAVACGGDPACCDLARLRIPGFHNHKDNPPMQVQLVSQTACRYPVALFEGFALGEGPAGTAPISSASPHVADMSEDLDRRFRQLWGHNLEVKRAWKGEIGDGSSDSRWVLVKRLKERGFTDEEILAIVCSRRWFNRNSRRVRPAADVVRDIQRLLARF